MRATDGAVMKWLVDIRDCLVCGAVTIMAPDLNEIEGREHVKAYRSSDWAERAFCAECGTHLYYHLLPVDDYILSAGLFEESSGFLFKRQIFIDQKPANYAFANDTEKLTEAQVFAQLS